MPAVVRFELDGKCFEIPCWRVKVETWRADGGDVKEVFQTDKIFESILKNRMAKDADLVEVFGTADRETIYKRILEEGELQDSPSFQDKIKAGRQNRKKAGFGTQPRMGRKIPSCTPSPAVYAHVPVFADKAYGVASFQATRMDWQNTTKGMPGPGEYDQKTTIAVAKVNNETAYGGFGVRSPQRGTMLMPYSPGPGKYDQATTLRVDKKVTQDPESKLGFGVSSKGRALGWRNNNPGPGEYEQASTIHIEKKVTTDPESKMGFGTQNIQRPPFIISKVPGPGTYEAVSGLNLEPVD